MASATKRMTKAEVRTLLEQSLAAWNAHDTDAIVAGLTDDIVWSHPGLTEPIRGKEAVRADLEATFRSFPDLHFPLEDSEVFLSDDPKRAVTTFTFVGTMTGRLAMGYDPTGRSVRVGGMSSIRISDGLIREQTIVYDGVRFMQQLGLLPAAGDLTFKVMLEAQNLVLRAKKALST